MKLNLLKILERHAKDNKPYVVVGVGPTIDGKRNKTSFHGWSEPSQRKTAKETLDAVRVYQNWLSGKRKKPDWFKEKLKRDLPKGLAYFTVAVIVGETKLFVVDIDGGGKKERDKWIKLLGKPASVTRTRKNNKYWHLVWLCADARKLDKIVRKNKVDFLAGKHLMIIHNLDEVLTNIKKAEKKGYGIVSAKDVIEKTPVMPKPRVFKNLEAVSLAKVVDPFRQYEEKPPFLIKITGVQHLSSLHRADRHDSIVKIGFACGRWGDESDIDLLVRNAVEAFGQTSYSEGKIRKDAEDGFNYARR